MRAFLPLLACGLACNVMLAAEPPPLSLSVENPNLRADHLAIGLHITTSGTGELVLELPQIIPEGDGSWEHPLQRELKVEKNSATVSYASGARFTYTIEPENEVLCTYASLPAGAQALWFPMMIPTSVRQGGRYSFAGETSKSFPDSPVGRSVEKARSGSFSLIGPSGEGFIISAPSALQTLSDFRPSWNAFSWSFSYPLGNERNGSFRLKLSASTSADRCPPPDRSGPLPQERYGETSRPPS